MRYEVLKYFYNCMQLKLAKIYRAYILQTAICSTSEDTEKQAVNSNRKKKKEDMNDILCKSTSTDFQEHLPLRKLTIETIIEYILSFSLLYKLLTLLKITVFSLSVHSFLMLPEM